MFVYLLRLVCCSCVSIFCSCVSVCYEGVLCDVSRCLCALKMNRVRFACMSCVVCVCLYVLCGCVDTFGFMCRVNMFPCVPCVCVCVCCTFAYVCCTCVSVCAISVCHVLSVCVYVCYEGMSMRVLHVLCVSLCDACVPLCATRACWACVCVCCTRVLPRRAPISALVARPGAAAGARLAGARAARPARHTATLRQRARASYFTKNMKSSQHTCGHNKFFADIQPF